MAVRREKSVDEPREPKRRKTHGVGEAGGHPRWGQESTTATRDPLTQRASDRKNTLRFRFFQGGHHVIS
jgi:hypothetical protein